MASSASETRTAQSKPELAGDTTAKSRSAMQTHARNTRIWAQLNTYATVPPHLRVKSNIQQEPDPCPVFAFHIKSCGTSKAHEDQYMQASTLITTRVAAGLSFAAVVISGMLLSSTGRASEEHGDQGTRHRQSEIQIGFRIAPVQLNLTDKDRELVGLGSYIVNAQSDCNGCHSKAPATEFVPTGNPYFLTPPFNGTQRINTATYLGGGRDFGPFPSPGGSVHIVSRNLTPDITGLPAGGLTFPQFLNILRTGIDLDTLHPSCSATITAHCLLPPFNGAVLQVMPWTAHQNMTDHDIRAIYEYLKAIPCIDTVDPANPQLHNVCP